MVYNVLEYISLSLQVQFRRAEERGEGERERVRWGQTQEKLLPRAQQREGGRHSGECVMV